MPTNPRLLKGLQAGTGYPIDSLPTRVKTAGSTGALSLTKDLICRANPLYMGLASAYSCRLVSMEAIAVYQKKDGYPTGENLLIHRKPKTLSRIRSPVWHLLSLERPQLKLAEKTPIEITERLLLLSFYVLR